MFITETFKTSNLLEKRTGKDSTYYFRYQMAVTLNAWRYSLFPRLSHKAICLL